MRYRSSRKRRNPSSVEQVLRALQPGDWVEVTFAARSSSSPDEKRTVVVTSRSEHSGHVYVTSGKVRPGHMAGGALLDYGDGKVYYQPTLQQAIRRVRSLHRTAVLPLQHNPRGDVRVTSTHIELDRYPEWPVSLPLAPVGRRMYTGQDPRKSMWGHATWIEEEDRPKSKDAQKQAARFVAQLDDKAVKKALDAMDVRYYSGRDDADALRSRLEAALYDRLMPFEQKKNPRRGRR